MAPLESDSQHATTEATAEGPFDAAVALPLGALFRRFLRFGCLAWGGPTAQIAMLRYELVEQERWIEPERFNRVLAVFQALPGPEAFELCCYFGHLRRGRWGAVVAGLGFLLPGLVLMLIASALYAAYGLGSSWTRAALGGALAVVAAMIVSAVFKLWKHVVVAPWLVGCALMSLVGTTAGGPFWAVLAGCAAAGRWHARRPRAAWAGMAVTLAACCAWQPVSAALLAPAPAPSPITGIPAVTYGKASLADIALTGLKAGLLTFGGAYTAIPVVGSDAYRPTDQGGWLTGDELGHALAIGAVLPAPLVIFCTMIGFLGAGWSGALLMTAGVFLPALSFTLIGHRHLERVVDDPRWHGALDAVAAGVVGMLALTAVRAIPASQPWQTAAFCVALVLLMSVRRAWIIPALVLAGAALGVGVEGLNVILNGVR
ncbi:MAG: chromate efflux transporter [Phycisphaerales bacterium]